MSRSYPFRSAPLFPLLLVAILVALLSGCGKSRSPEGTALRMAASSGERLSTSAPPAAAEKSMTRSDAAESEAAYDIAGAPEEAGAADGKGVTSEFAEPSPQKAGQLTAAEWSDLDNWAFWSGLMRSGEWSGMTEHWGINTEGKISVDITTGRAPVVDASVALVDRSGNTLWRARTNRDGRAELFPNGNAEDAQQGEYNLIVEADGFDRVERRIGGPTNAPLKIDVSGTPRAASNLDIMFMIDATGSMGDEMEYIKAELKDVIDRVDRSSRQTLDIRTSCNVYRDKDDDYVVRSFPFTEDVDEALDQLNPQQANGGGDYEEAVVEALENAIEKHSWSEHAVARFLFLVLDAPPHHTSANVKKLQKLTRRAAELGIRIVPVASSGVDKDTEFLMRMLDISTGGTYVFLTDDSGIGNSHIVPTIGPFAVRYLDDLLVEIIGRYATGHPSKPVVTGADGAALR